VKPSTRFLLSTLTIGFFLVLAIIINYRTIPTGDTKQTHFDALIVLGTPARPDGSPSPEQRERVLEGLRQYRAGTAAHIIMTGGAAHNAFTEAHVMAKLAMSQGIPAEAILEEDQARNTIQNIFYSAQIMHQHGWSSAEIVSSPSHLSRASLIVQTFDREQPALGITWHTHPASWPPEYNLFRRLSYYSAEATYCLRLRLIGFPRSRFLPTS
jgi:uncharacterized SAM-binding protein YcdF (DUF218 family)